jgi:hypothetical protein
VRSAWGLGLSGERRRLGFGAGWVSALSGEFFLEWYEIWYNSRLVGPSPVTQAARGSASKEQVVVGLRHRG